MRGIKLVGVAAMCLAAFSGSAWAETGGMPEQQVAELPSLTGESGKGNEPFKLAENDSVVMVKNQQEGESVVQPAEFEPPLLTGGNVHKYLGIATVVAAAGTFLTHFHTCQNPACPPQPPRQTNGLHATLGKATAALALATVASGLLTHWDDFDMEDGLTDPDNMHVILGVTGAALMAYAINKSATSNTPVNHAALAELGALSMVMAIKLAW